MQDAVWSLSLLLSTSAAPAFPQSFEANVERFRFTTSVNAVHLSVTVVNKKGKLVTNLKEEDFRVLEDERIQAVSYFSRGVDAPVDFVILVDASGSMDVTAKSANARNAAVQLIHGLGPEDRVSVYAFDRDLYRVTDFTQSKEDAIGALTRLEPFGSTALYDAVATLSEVVVHEGFGRRAIVVLTDGVDTSSETSVEAAVAKAKGVDLPVYAIRVLSPVDDPGNDLFLGVHGASFRGEDSLRQFTSETGGATFEGSQWGQLVLASARIREELKTQYRIGYVPDNPRTDGGFRRIQVSTRRRGVEVRTRQGYYPRESESGPQPSSASSPNRSPQ
ncbi:MAG TPA: VWA domain-containing protein [Vicinamibacteria bacterium]|nr:VWA domain-containing protein [Vicinamibacteria bacterium]